MTMSSFCCFRRNHEHISDPKLISSLPISCSLPFLSSFLLPARSSLVLARRLFQAVTALKSLNNIFLLSGQLVASMFNLLAGNFQHVQLATALAQLRTGADHRCSIYTGDEMRKIL